MCNRCLFADEHAIDWMPLYSQGSTKMRPSPRRTRPYAKQKQINWGAIRGLDMPGWNNNKIEVNLEDFDPDADYSERELEAYADAMLRADAKVVDTETGKARGIGGKDPILFAEHLYQRRKREILNENGVPEPNLVSGIYNRAHPEGRKINSPEARKNHGASYFKG